ncbi:MAG: DUF3047 domain-containing protein [bacterium]
MRFTFFVVFLISGLSALAQPLFTLDFQTDIPGKFPSGWDSKDKDGMTAVYSIFEEDGNPFLRGDALGTSVTIGLDREWNLADYPILKWRWRAVTMPAGTNEREKSGNDNVLGMYVVFGGWPIPQSIKYIWSETLPVGTILPSPFSSKTQMIVIRSGTEGLGEWVVEERNVLEDYRMAFSKPSESPNARGIGVLTDSDNTKTHAVGDYDDISVLPLK